MCLADAIHNFKWVKIIQIWQMDVDYFQILLIIVTFYLQYVWKLIGSVLIKNVKNEYNRHRQSKG